MLPNLAPLLGAERCVGCGSRAAALCEACARALPRAPEAHVPGVRRTLAPWSYEGTARALVLALKLRSRRAAAEPLAAGMVAEVARAGLAAELVTWVPGRRRDLRRRGFDHAEVLARGVAAGLGAPARPLLRRARDSTDQTALAAAARRRNLAGVFVAAAVPVPVVVVDDVVTTGATAASCAAALAAAGAPAVELLASCRS